LNNRAPANQKLAEVQITGKDNSIDQLTALIWNNTFIGYPFPLPNSTPKSAVRVNSAVVTITNNTFRYYNDYGVRILKSEAKINLNYFENNKGTTGALSFDNYATYSGRAVENVVFANVFDNNRAPNGAAISLLNTAGSLVRTSILQNIFQENKSDNNGGALNALDISNLVIENNSFYNNSAVKGGAVYLRGTGMMREKIVNSTSSIAFTDNIFAGNESTEEGGGAIIINAPELTLTRNLFNDNSGNGGAGLYISNSNLALFNCNFNENQGLANGGGLYLEVNEANQITIQNCNFANHGNAGGIAIVNNIQPSGINIYNTLFYGNNTGTTGKAIVFSSTQNVITTNCYFDIIPSGFSVSNNNPHQNTWPGWLGASNFYLDCLNSVCVDNGNPDAVYNDREDGQTGQALFPSCGILTNDIGISGGPFAANRIWLFQPNPSNTANKMADSPHKNQIAPNNFLQSDQTNVVNDNLQIYPNPSSGYITISNLEGLEGDYNLTMMNNKGVKATDLKVQIKATDETLQFDFSTLPKGMYFMMLTNQNQLITKKIILN